MTIIYRRLSTFIDVYRHSIFMKITTSAPGKLLLLGDHAVVWGYPCLVTAVNYRVFVEVSLSQKDEFIFPEGNGSSFVYTALELFRKKFGKTHNVRIKTWAEYKESYGLGSSSAVTVALMKALAGLFSINLTNKELFDICYKVVLKIQGVGSGFDIAAAIWGGTLYFVTGGKKIEPLHVNNLPLIIAYSGSKGDTATLVKGVGKLYKEKPEEIKLLFQQSEKLVNEGEKLLVQQNYQTFGKLMNENHRILQQIKVSTPKLDELVNAAQKAGAYGAKLSGAGGGDCMIALAPPDKKEAVEKALEKAGGTILSVRTNEEGVRVEN